MYSFKLGSTGTKRVLRTAASFCLPLLAACGGGGSHSSPETSAPPSVTLSVQPTSIPLGDSAELSWTVTAGASCAASGGWAGPEPATGTQIVRPNAVGAIAYTLTCRTPSGGPYSAGGPNAAKTVTLEVSASNVFFNTTLTADTASALVFDPRLVNPWGVAMSAISTAWAVNQGSNTATLYDGNGRAQPAANPRTVAFPARADGAPFEPTGIVGNSSADFVIGNAGASGPARFLFAGKRGALAGWSPAVDASQALVAYEDPTSEYTGLAIAVVGSNSYLYAADFRNRRIDVFASDFSKQEATTEQFTFADGDLPADYAPYGIQALNTGIDHTPEIYVSYAKRSGADNLESERGAGLGRIDVYGANGDLLKALIVQGGLLDTPWGMALSPPDLGLLSNRLLVGNLGDGRINAFGFSTGQYSATLSDSLGTPIAVSGLHGIAFGNDMNNQPHTTLFYTAGTNDEHNGSFGRLDLGATPPLLNQPPVVAITAPASGVVSATETVTATVVSSIAVARVDFLAGENVFATDSLTPFTVEWDTSLFGDGPVLLRAIATDVDGNVGVSIEVPVTIENGAPTVSLAQIQGLVFTPICSGCHNGSNPTTGALPGSQNLTAGNSFANLVNVTSKEVPALLRVKPSDPANSYLIRKLEGAADIQGSRMPLGGPFLDQPTIDLVKMWIAGGAPND
jgi:uncharacterized protein (TIGR03118 family)